jgi:hypothetical protein
MHSSENMTGWQLVYWFMKAIRDVHSFFQEESFKIKNNQPILPHTAIMQHVLKVTKNTLRQSLKEFENCNSPGKKRFCFYRYCYSEM